jgi:ABC-type transport system substrate-binding protein
MSFERRPGRDTARDATPDLGDAAGCVPVERIEWPVMDDASTRWMAFLSGALDMEGNIPRDNLDSVLAPDGTLRPALAGRGIRLLRQSGMDTFYIGLNMDDPVLGPNKALRQALNAAFDFAAWSAVNPGKGTPSAGPVPANVEGCLDTPFPYAHDEAKARALLAEAGYPGGIDPATGRRLSLALDLGQTDQETRESAELMASFFERVGIVLEPRFNNWPAFLTKVRNRQAQMFQVGWIADYPDAENFLQLFYGPNASPGPNRCNYSNPAFDDLYRRAMAATGEAERLALYGEMQRLLQEDPPWIFMSFSKAVSLGNPGLERYLLHDFPYGMEKHLRHR